MIKKMLVAVLFLIGFTVSASAFNAADVTAWNRVTEEKCVGMFFFPQNAGKMSFVNVPVADKASFTLMQWESKGGFVRDMEVNLAVKVTPSLDLSFYNVNFNIPSIGASLMENTIGVDYHIKGIGIGAVIPMTNGEVTQVGARYTYKTVTGYVSWSTEEDPNPIFGVTFKTKFAEFKLSRDSFDSNYVRIATMLPLKSGVIIVPELWYQSDPDGSNQTDFGGVLSAIITKK